MKICRWCGIPLRGRRRFAAYCKTCDERMQDCGINLSAGGPPCFYMAHLPKAFSEDSPEIASVRDLEGY